MIKENLKIQVKDSDRKEVIGLLVSLGHHFTWDVKTQWSKIAHIFAYSARSPLEWNSDTRVGDIPYFKRHKNKEITLPELRELAQTKDYLNDKYELFVTNQPEDGWVLVPEGAEYYVQLSAGITSFFYTNTASGMSFFEEGSKWTPCFFSSSDELYKILWQRKSEVITPNKEVIMQKEKEGRFLHQEWYEAFGRGEDVQIAAINKSEFFNLSQHHSLGDFDNPQYKFRLKPKTIAINGKEINAPISVKPSMGTMIYLVDLFSVSKVRKIYWQGDMDTLNRAFTRGLIHLSEADALNHANAMLDLGRIDYGTL